MHVPKCIQHLLFMVGVTLFTAMVCAFGLALIGALTLFARDPREHGTGAWGGYLGILFCWLIGAFVGTLMGLWMTLSLISNHDYHPWKYPTWIGIAVGCLAGLAIRQYMEIRETYGPISDVVRNYLVGFMIFVTFTATCGGFAGHLVQAIWLPTPRRKHKTGW